jgi:pimeloyl-ACP methyl ester carboxylesterase
LAWLPLPNPDFQLDKQQQEAALARLASATGSLPRPVIFIGGYRSPGILLRSASRKIATLVKPDPGQSLVVPITLASSMQAAARTVKWALVKAGLHDAQVDIVAFSMGGLVARAMAAGLFPEIRPLQIKRLFTLATPHRGAWIASVLAPDSAAIDMVPQSPFLQRLDEALPCADFDLLCYAQLRDWWIGTQSTSPPGRDVHWIDPVTLLGRTLSHFTVCGNQAILIDIALRLRELTPLAQRASAAPLIRPFTRKYEPSSSPSPASAASWAQPRAASSPEAGSQAS